MVTGSCYQIEARVTLVSEKGRTNTDVPTFYLDPDIQGIVSARHACKVALDTIDRFRLLTVHVVAYKQDTGDYHSVTYVKGKDEE